MHRPGYIPDRGDFIWIDLNPRMGHEQAGYRPALVLSPLRYNEKSGLCVICPATSKVKRYPFEVPNPDAEDPNTVILVDQIRCADWRVRPPRLIHRVSSKVLEQVIEKLVALVIDPIL